MKKLYKDKHDNQYMLSVMESGREYWHKIIRGKWCLVLNVPSELSEV